MSVLRANVRRVTGHTRHRTVGSEGVRDLPQAHTLRITPDGEGAFLLLRFDNQGRGITDTWHETVAAAKAQASAEYGVSPNDWMVEANQQKRQLALALARKA